MGPAYSGEVTGTVAGRVMMAMAAWGPDSEVLGLSQSRGTRRRAQRKVLL
jgi:hypothetical protein